MPKRLLWVKAGGAEGWEQRKSEILGSSSQKCQREAETSTGLFISDRLGLNMNSPFPYDPRLAGDLELRVFHFISGHAREIENSLSFPS